MAALGVMTLLYLVIWAQMTGQRLKKHYPLLPALLYLLLDGYVMLPVEHLPLWGHIAGYVANGIAYTMSLAGVLLALWVYRCLHRPVQAA